MDRTGGGRGPFSIRPPPVGKGSPLLYLSSRWKNFADFMFRVYKRTDERVVTLMSLLL